MRRTTPAPRNSFSRRHLLAVASAALFCGAALVTSASAYSDGPPNGYTGGPPYFENCTTCHYTYEVNSGDGTLQLIGLPAAYEPGETYQLQVQLADLGQLRWGFELTVIDDSDPDSPLSGGQLSVTDPINAQMSEDYFNDEDYMKQTEVGSFSAVFDGPVTWDFAWTAPGLETPSVTFYFAGNAANNNGIFLGDYIYTRSEQLFLETGTPTEPTTWGRVKQLYSSR